MEGNRSPRLENEFPRRPRRAILALMGAAGLVTAFVASAPGAAKAGTLSGGAGATVTPTLSVSASAGPVGSAVTVQFGPAGDGCAAPGFARAQGSAGVFLGEAGFFDHGSRVFVIPSVLGSPPNQSAVTPGSYVFSLTCDTTNNPATAITVTVPFTVTPTAPNRVVGVAAAPDGKGYWLAQAGGGVFSYGDAGFYGSLPGEGITPRSPIFGITATPDGKGYWLVGADGGVFSFGDARFFGSLGSAPPAEPVVAIVATRDGQGYWLVSADGFPHRFGDAAFFSYRSPGLLDPPIVGMASTPDGGGYWEVAADGGVFSFGDARFFGSMGGKPLNRPIVGIVADPNTGGYWEVASDGGVFAFGAPFLGSTGSFTLNAPVAAITGTPTGLGYRLVAADGGVFDFGDAGFYGSAA
jgi:hypothetical protein